MKYFFIQMGGTIDKDYPKNTGGYSFEIAEAAFTRILSRSRVNFNYEFIICTRKDSLEIETTDRERLVKLIEQLPDGHIIITHGTDTLIETGLYLEMNINRPAVLTGSMRPERFRNSDADLNLGMAIGTAGMIKSGIYIAIQGLVKKASDMLRDDKTGLFF